MSPDIYAKTGFDFGYLSLNSSSFFREAPKNPTLSPADSKMFVALPLVIIKTARLKTGTHKPTIEMMVTMILPFIATRNIQKITIKNSPTKPTKTPAIEPRIFGMSIAICMAKQVKNDITINF